MKDLLQYLPAMRGKRIAVFGDLIADEYLSGTIHRFSREAPVFIVDYERSEIRGGGAANAANNIRALGGIPYPFGVVGNDAPGRKLLECLRACDIATDAILVGDRPTFVKQRVLAGSPHSEKQQILRIDRCFRLPPDSDHHSYLAEKLAATLPELDGLLISDYGLGTVVPSSSLHRLMAALPSFVDSRYNIGYYHGATAATPNEPELEAIAGHLLSDGALRDAGSRLLKDISARALLVTRGKKGMALFTPEHDPIFLAPFGSSDIVDVTGAGDTVIGAFALAVVAGAGFADAARLANCAAGLKVMKRGAACVSQHELIAALSA